VCLIADGAIYSSIVNLAGACAISVSNTHILASLWSGAGERPLDGFIPLGLWAGPVGGAATALVFTLLRHRPAVGWLRNTMHTLATFLAALGIGRCCGVHSYLLLVDAVLCAYVALVGIVVVHMSRWPLGALDPCNLQVSTACSITV